MHCTWCLCMYVCSVAPHANNVVDFDRMTDFDPNADFDLTVDFDLTWSTSCPF